MGEARLRNLRKIPITFQTLEALIDASEEELKEVVEVGSNKAASIREYFDNPRNREIVRKLREAGVQERPPERRAAGSSGGQDLCVYRGVVPFI